MIALGNNEISKAYIGGTEIDKMYLGETIVFDNGSMREIEYLSFGGTQWINTGIIPNQDNLNVIIDAYITGSGNQFLYGINGSSPRLNLNLYSGTGANFRYRNYNKAFTTTKGRHVFENGPQKIIDGTVLDTPTYTTSMTTNTNKYLVLGASPNAAVPTSVSYCITGQIYSFSVYYGDSCILNMIPVRIGQVGYMYDAISESLFGNDGSGSFGLGNDIRA